MKEIGTMTDRFIFHGQTTFIDKPRETVIHDFQNTYITGDGSDRDKVNAELKELVELILASKELPEEEKEESVQAVHQVAEQVKNQKGSKLTVKGSLKAVQEVVSKASDIAIPAMNIISTALKLLALA
jgi:hypothetical protein